MKISNQLQVTEFNKWFCFCKCKGSKSGTKTSNKNKSFHLFQVIFNVFYLNLVSPFLLLRCNGFCIRLIKRNRKITIVFYSFYLNFASSSAIEAKKSFSKSSSFSVCVGTYIKILITMHTSDLLISASIRLPSNNRPFNALKHVVASSSEE